MGYHNGQQFSTYDNDNDIRNNCAYVDQGGWWFKTCYRANLNGPHNLPPNPSVSQTFARLIWYDGDFRDVSSSEMKIRPKQCIPYLLCEKHEGSLSEKAHRVPQQNRFM